MLKLVVIDYISTAIDYYGIDNISFNFIFGQYQKEVVNQISDDKKTIIHSNIYYFNQMDAFLTDMCKIDNKDIIVFDDGLNDQEMLEKCGIGVAMGNALQQVKTNAKYTTLFNDEDGVITFLKEYLNEN